MSRIDEIIEQLAREPGQPLRVPRATALRFAHYAQSKRYQRSADVLVRRSAGVLARGPG